MTDRRKMVDKGLVALVLLVASAMLIESETIQFKCSSGWEKIYERCYLFVPYQHTWSEALKYCHRHGAVLAEPKGFDITGRLAIEASNLGLQKFWIGYNRIDHTGDASDIGYWSDGRQTGVEVGVWAPYEPQVDKGDCAYIGGPWDDLDDVKRWYFDTCSQVYPSVCERTPCPEDTYNCYSGRCVASSAVCDGLNSCGDSSDEIHCPSQCSYLETGTSGQVESPRAGFQELYSPNLNCQWTIQGNAGTRIQIQFDQFETETDLDFVEIWDGGSTVSTSQLITRLSGPSAGEFVSYVSSTNWLIVRLVTDGSVEKSGFNFTWVSDFQCEMRRMAGKAVPVDADGFSITLGSLQSVDYCASECVRSKKCRGVQYDVHQTGNRECFLVTEPLRVQDDSCCDVYVKTCPGETSLTSFDTVPVLESTLRATVTEQYLYTPLFPLPYIGNMEVTYTVVVSGTRLITFEILSADLCCSDRILFYDGPDPTSPLLLTVEGTTEAGVVISTTNTVFVHMQLLSHWSCPGAFVSYKTGCDMELTSVTGVVQSPGYGITSYPGVASCTWLISPSTATSIRFIFQDFDLEKNMDFLEIYEGRNETGNALHTGRGYTGSAVNVTIVTIKSLFIKFTSSAVGSGRGFKAIYSSGCPQLSSQNAILTPATDTYHAPDTVSMSCLEGYYFIGSHRGLSSVVLTCLTSGSWDKNPVPVCERGHCGFAPTIEKGFIRRSTGVQGGDTAEFQCETGYNATGPTIITCLSNNTWEMAPSCQSPVCEDLTTVYDTDYVEVVLGDGVSHGSLVKVTCPLYYQLIGPQTVECVAGKWKMSLPTCERIPCPVPAIQNADLDLRQDFYISNQLYVSCLPGYVIEGRTDQTDTDFACGLDSPPQCINIDECALDDHMCIGATCVDTEGSYRCECLPGYQPLGTSLTECQDVDECAENLAFCDHECTNTNGSYVCSCYDEYDLYMTPNFNDLDLGNDEDGSQPWHNFHINHSCVLKKCDSGPILQLVNGQALTSKTSFFSGDQVEYLCNIGYKVGNSLAKSQTVICQDGDWDILPSCMPAYCTNITDPDAVPASNIRYGDTIQKQCRKRNGDLVTLERKCGFNRFLNDYRTSGDSFQCPETDCGEPPRIKGTEPYDIDCTVYNCTFEFRCRSQYQQQGTSSRGDYTVRCTEDGLWDFGDLTCQGGQCPDPGFPENGYTTFTSYNHGNEVAYTVEEGSIATFHCNRDGYTPKPPNVIVCQETDDGSLAWNGTVPTCTDTTPPVFLSCPDTQFVDPYSPVNYEVPIATDNTVVYKRSVSPENFQPRTVVDYAFRVRYTAVDEQGLSTDCDFWIYLIDSVPPEIECVRPDILYVTGPGQREIHTNTSDFINVAESDFTITAYPPVVYIDESSVGRNPTVDYLVSDISGNTAVCKSQLRIEGPSCDEKSLEFYYENVNCTTVGSRINCQVTCTDGYVFYEDPSAPLISLFCENGAWSREAPICTDSSDAYYSLVYQLYYLPEENIFPDTCEDTYNLQIQNQLVTLTNALENLCQMTTPDISVMHRTAKPVEVTLQAQDRVSVRVALEIRPDGLPDSQYTDCAAEILESFRNKESEIQSIETLTGSEHVCSQVTLEQYSASQVTQAFSCLSASKPAQKEDNLHICVACPPGMYHEDNTCKLCPAGTFNSAFYKQSCELCPGDTNSKGEGLRSDRDCRNWCAPGLYSDNGLTPCTDCPPNTYWVNGNGTEKATCEPCPFRTNTKGRGAKSMDDCLSHCQPGEYSATGLAPCLICPLHHYQAGTKATRCSPCSTNAITLTVGAKTQQECFDGTASICASQPCKNSGTCEVKRHTFFCTCHDGWTGSTCETPVTPCDRSPCINGGICTSIDLNRYTCSCPDGLGGQNCEIDGDQCSGDRCSNNGTCIDQNMKFLCTCPSYSGFYGNSCELPQNPCVKDPCLNNGQCIAENNFYRLCLCAEGFSGIDCEIDLDDCTPGLCMNGGTCVDGPNSFTCECPDGFRGTYCHLRDYDAVCPLGACTGRQCVDNYLTETKYCQCFPGSRFGSIADDCVEITECSNVDCGFNGNCMSYDHGYNYKCKCDVGYAGEECLFNVDDCASRPCQNEASCSDGINDYSCTCTLDGTGGKNCSDIEDGCLQCVQDYTASCVDTLDSYTCVCVDGYTGMNCETKIPSCASLPCQHNGTCSNPVTPEFHACSCLLPWTGPNCETEIDNCAAGTVCENDGTCYSTSDGFLCVCHGDYKGERCEEEYSFCDVANPCVGNSTCTDVQGSAKCECEDGYTGKSCETLIWFCTDTTCLNGGTCSVEEIDGIVCKCMEGFTGSRCAVNIDECASDPCPRNSDCIDGINGYSCQCRNGKIGENCEKDASNNFDYVISSPVTCSDLLQYTSFSLVDTAAISVAFWVRHVVLNRPGTILSLYGATTREQTRPKTPYHIKVNGTHVSMMLSTLDDAEFEERIIDGVDIQDGYWHHIVVTWGKDSGELTFYVDGTYNNQATIGLGENLPQFGLLQLGMDRDEVALGSTSYFIGHISQLQLYDHQMSAAEVRQAYSLEVLDTPRSSVLNQEQTTMLQYSVDYSSHLKDLQCLDYGICDYFDEASLPSVSSCPDDVGVIAERVASPEWPSAEFNGVISETYVKSNYEPGGLTMTYGIVGISSAGYSPRGSAAVCTFNLYNRGKACESPVSSADLTDRCSPLDGEDGLVCKIDCATDNYLPTQPVPFYQSCSKYGMWDQSERLTEYLYPTCAVSSDLTINLTVTIQYTTTEACSTVSQNLATDTLTALRQLSSRYNNDLCQFEQGLNDVMCATAEISVECTDTHQAELMITLPWIRATIDSVSVREILMIALVDDGQFTFDMYAVPDFQSVEMMSTSACKYGTHEVGGRCVVCGSGSYFNSTLLRCVLCPAGTYRTVQTTTNLFSECTRCPGSETTNYEGAISRRNCHTSCYLGHFYDVTSGKCIECPVGFYQDSLGQSSCHPCAVDQSTAGSGAQRRDQCIAVSILTTDSVETTTNGTLGGPGVGASREEGGLSAGVIVAIVICCLIAIVAVVILILCCCKARLPCLVDKSTVAPQKVTTPWKRVNKYGETNLHYANYRLSDIRDYKAHSLDKIPIYPHNVSPDESISADMPVNVPIFTERLDGRITKKQWLMSSNVRHSEYSDVDQLSERPDSGRPDSVKLSSDKRGPGSRPKSGRTGSERRAPVSHQLSTERRGPGSVTESAKTGSVSRHMMSFSRRKHPGRPPAILAPIPLPQMLAPTSHRATEVGLPQSMPEYIPPLPGSERPRKKVTPLDYQDFLETRHQQVRPHPQPVLTATSTSQGTSHGSDKILLDSDEEDYR